MKKITTGYDKAVIAGTATLALGVAGNRLTAKERSKFKKPKTPRFIRERFGVK